MAMMDKSTDTIQKDNFVKMVVNVQKYQNTHHDNPTIVYIETKRVDYISYNKFMEMLSRYNKYESDNGRPPNQIFINKPVTRKVGPIQKVIESHLGMFDDISEFANKMRGRGYSHYTNDQKSLGEEDTLLAQLNCVDSTQLLIHLADEMGGYDFRYCHVYCRRSGEGHIYAEGKGRELGPNYRKIDLAAMMSKATMAKLFDGWCFDVKVSSYDDPWLKGPDDGR